MFTKNNIPYTLTRKRNCKNIIIKIVHGQVKITAPLHVSKQEINRFANSKEAWMLTHLEDANNQIKKWQESTTFMLFGVLYQLCFHAENRTRITIKRDEQNKKINVHLPQQTSDLHLQRAMKRFMHREAFDYFETCLLALRQRQAVFPVINQYLLHWRYRFMKTAFGLCYAQKGEIVLNTELVLYDKKYVEYVILHELSHFYYQDHSANFYRVFAAMEPNWKILKKELNDLHKQYGGWSHL